MRSARYVALLCSFVLLGMLGCQKKPIASVYVLGQPKLASDFATTGKFGVDALPVAADGSAIELSDASAVTFEIDSPPGGAYTVTVNAVQFTHPSTSKVSYGVLLDGSGSMSSSDSLRLRNAATKELIRRLRALNTDNLVSIADFGVGMDSAYYFRLLEPYAKVADTLALFQALDSVTESGGTPLYTSIIHDLNYTDGAVSAGAYGRRLLVLTDGEDNGSNPEDSLGAVIELAAGKQIPVYVIGLGSGANGEDLQRLATGTHGIYAQVDSAAGLEPVFQAIGAGATQGYDNIQAQFSPIPVSGTDIEGRMIIYAGGTSASGTIRTRIP